MSIMTDTIISSTQTSCDNNADDYKQIVVVFDENQYSYEVLAWHSCPISSELDQQLILLVRESKKGDSWLGTLTTTKENQLLLWKNHLHNRQHQLYLSKHRDSLITHFRIQETSDSIVRYSIIK